MLLTANSTVIGKQPLLPVGGIKRTEYLAAQTKAKNGWTANDEVVVVKLIWSDVCQIELRANVG